MAWGTLNGIKDWLQIASTNTQYDTELTNTQTYVNRRMASILKKYSDPSSLQPDLTNELSDIENKWSAGVFRQRRADEKDQRDGLAFIKEAQDELWQFIDTHYKRGFFKVGLRSLKSILVGEKSSASVVK